MKWLLVSPQDHRRAAGWVGSGVTAFIAAGLAGGLAAPSSALYWGTAGFVSLVLCARKAMALWRIDEMVFDHRRQWNLEARPSVKAAPRAAPEPLRPRKHLVRVLGLAILTAVTTCSASGQQTIFNVPTADVLDKGKLYFETDWLWRPNAPSFATGSLLRGVYGFGGNVEGGINFAGINTPGRSVPTAIAAVKWQPLKTDGLALTIGAHGLFFLRGSGDGDPAGQFYTHASYAFPTKTRITAGGWWASSGFANAGVEKGGLFGLEQTITANVTLAADWYTGHNGIGYASPGAIVTAGRWVLYVAYSIKNGNSKGNGLLLELGFNVP
jgi:hypothetical protein